MGEVGASLESFDDTEVRCAAAEEDGMPVRFGPMVGRCARATGSAYV